jgi:hypothetical protein
MLFSVARWPFSVRKNIDHGISAAVKVAVTGGRPLDDENDYGPPQRSLEVFETILSGGLKGRILFL